MHAACPARAPQNQGLIGADHTRGTDRFPFVEPIGSRWACEGVPALASLLPMRALWASLLVSLPSPAAANDVDVELVDKVLVGQQPALVLKVRRAVQSIAIELR